MANNKAVIPLYLNTGIVKNLFTIIVQEFIEAKTVTTKDQLTVNIKAPMSEFSYDLFGKYVQGEFSAQIVNEFSKQKTEASISKDIEVFIKLRNMLKEYNLLKNIEKSHTFNDIHENDFIIFKGELNQNPMLQYLENIIKVLELQIAFNLNFNEEERNGDLKYKKETLSMLKSNVEDCYKSKCIRFVTNDILSPNGKAVVPIHTKNMIDNIDYLTGGKVNILGKVVKVADGRSGETINLLSGTYFDFLSEDYFKSFVSKFLSSIPLIGELGLQPIPNSIPLIEVLPIAIFA